MPKSTQVVVTQAQGQANKTEEQEFQTPNHSATSAGQAKWCKFKYCTGIYCIGFWSKMFKVPKRLPFT